MLAKLARELPRGNYIYEPKWDGFRAIVFRSGDELELASRNELSLTRYFPELVDLLKTRLPPKVVLDGEVVVAGPQGLDFDALSERLHPAASRVKMLSEATPASFVAFDLLALSERDLRGEPFAERRKALEGVFASAPSWRAGPPSAHVTPATRDPQVAEDWFTRFEGAGLDGVVAKPEGLEYLEGKRAMVKVKHERTADFVVAGFRFYRGQRDMLGSLMLGLYDHDATLAHVGVIGSFSARDRRAMLETLLPLRALPGAGLEEHPWAQWAAAGGGGAGGQGLPGARSRWNATKDLSFEPVRPELVVEASYEHLQGRRLRHTAQFRRWRPERAPLSCTYDQLEVAVPLELAEVLGAR